MTINPRKKPRISTEFVFPDGKIGTRSKIEDLQTLSKRIFSRIQQVLEDDEANRHLAPGIHAYDCADYEAALTHLTETVADHPQLTEELYPHIRICKRVLSVVLTPEDIRCRNNLARYEGLPRIIRSFKSIPTFIVRCKYCGHYTHYLGPNEGLAYLGTNNCHLCGRGYPVPDFVWDGIDGQAYIYYRHSVTEKEFYEEFEKEFGVSNEKEGNEEEGKQRDYEKEYERMLAESEMVDEEEEFDLSHDEEENEKEDYESEYERTLAESEMVHFGSVLSVSNKAIIMKKCPFCAEDIQDEAIKCKHCGEWLKDNIEESSEEHLINNNVGALDDRILCPDENCIGTLNSEGICVECGRTPDEIQKGVVSEVAQSGDARYIPQNLLKHLRLSAKVTILSLIIFYLVAGIADAAGFKSDFSMAVASLFLFAGAIAGMFFLFYIGKLANLLFLSPLVWVGCCFIIPVIFPIYAYYHLTRLAEPKTIYSNNSIT